MLMMCKPKCQWRSITEASKHFPPGETVVVVVVDNCDTPTRVFRIITITPQEQEKVQL